MNKIAVNSKKMIFGIIVIFALIFGSFALAGCTQNAESNNDNNENEIQAQVEIGENTKDCYKLQVINDTNVPVRQLIVKDNNAGESKELSIKSEDNTWKTSEVANIYIPKSNVENQNTDAELKDTFDFDLVIDDSIQVLMHSISPESLQSVLDLRLRYSEVDNLCYFEYMEETGPVSTLESEKAAVEQEKAAREKQEREAEEQAKAQEAEAEANSAASTSNNVATDTYVAPSGGNSATESSAPSAGSGAAQSEDQCAPDAVLNY